MVRFTCVVVVLAIAASSVAEEVPAEIVALLKSKHQGLPSPFAKGQVGILPPCKVRSVIDDNLVHVDLRYGSTWCYEHLGNPKTDGALWKTHEIEAVLRVPTSELVDDASVSFAEPFRCLGTQKYTSVFGATRQLFLLEPISKDQLKAWSDEARWKTDAREWKDKSGAVLAFGMYAGFKPGFVVVQTQDGETRELQLIKLSDADRRLAVTTATERGDR